MVRCGIASVPLTDYITGMLVAWLKPVQTFDPRALCERSLEDLVLEAASCLPPLDPPASALNHRQRVLQNAGEFALFWTGLFPEEVARINPLPTDPIADFRDHGQRFFRQAAELTEDDHAPPPSVLALVSEAFDDCTVGLRLIRTELGALRRAG